MNGNQESTGADWLSWSEQKRSLLIGGMATICFFALAITALRNPVTADSFWHLQMGKDWIENGLSPWIDHYSFTFFGREVLSPPILFQAALHWFVSQLGVDGGYHAFKLVFFALTLGLVLTYLRRVRAPVFVYCIVLPMVVALVELRAMVRPELLSYSLSVVALMLYWRAGHEISSRTMWPVVLLMCFWTNYHAPIVGYVIFFGLFVDAAMVQWRERTPRAAWLQWLGWGVLVVAVGALRPGFTHPVLQNLAFDPDWKRYISEYQSALLYINSAAAYLLAALTVLTLVLCLRQRRVGYTVIILVLVYAGLSMARMVTPAGIVILCLFAHVVSESGVRSWLAGQTRKARLVTGSAILAFVALALWTTVYTAREFMLENKQSRNLFPADVVAYIRESGLAGNIFNQYRIGGYLIHALAPQSKVYIDGRTHVLYPIDHYRQLLRAQNSPEVLREEVEKYDINLAMMLSQPANYFLMDGVGGFSLEYADNYYALFVRGRGNFPVTGHLLARPACWSDGMAADLAGEHTRAILTLTPQSSLWPFLGLAMSYGQRTDETAFFNGLEQVIKWDDASLRFAAFRALAHGRDRLALELLGALAEPGIKDHLAGALALVRLGQLDTAERTMQFASQTAWPYLELPDLVFMRGLIHMLERHRPISLISESYLAFLNEQLGQAGVAGKSYRAKLKYFCAPEGWQERI